MVYIDGEERDTSPVRPLWRDYKSGVRTVIGREEGVATYRLGLRRVPVDELGWGQFRIDTDFSDSDLLMIKAW